MDTNIVLTVFSLIIGAGLAITGIVLTIKFRQKPKLVYVQLSFVSLVRSVVQSFKEIEIYYIGVPIEPSVLYLKGSIINDGNVDIDKTHVHEPLSIELPKDYLWLEGSISGASRDLKAEYHIETEQIVRLDLDLIKKGEGFTFHCLIQAPDVDSEIPQLKFSHRITDLEQVEVSNLQSEEMEPTREWSAGVIVGIVFGVIGLGLAIWALIERGWMDALALTVVFVALSLLIGLSNLSEYKKRRRRNKWRTILYGNESQSEGTI